MTLIEKYKVTQAVGHSIKTTMDLFPRTEK